MNIYVGSIPFKIKEEELKQVFRQYGEVSSVKIVIDKITRQNKGFAFIEMPDDDEGRYAIHKLHCTELMGRQIEVSLSVKSDNNRLEHVKKELNREQHQRNLHRANTQKKRTKR